MVAASVHNGYQSSRRRRHDSHPPQASSLPGRGAKSSTHLDDNPHVFAKTLHVLRPQVDAHTQGHRGGRTPCQWTRTPTRDNISGHRVCVLVNGGRSRNLAPLGRGFHLLSTTHAIHGLNNLNVGTVPSFSAGVTGRHSSSLLSTTAAVGAICDGFATYTAPLYTSLMVQKLRAAGDAVICAPAALGPNTLPSAEHRAPACLTWALLY
ncbi:hypothetical protein FA95DRAFT_1614279 [Auriscalpium vulgare]|uniref:Uncharacterized protein n=1 Tax=Auriscalpium vulgare TaxID=40419 RepID=A0ACB8R0I9_9AGAM|nr:hypothetical protein FA95DRAFT_1614279 [Auriscalpium vulgare]